MSKSDCHAKNQMEVIDKESIGVITSLFLSISCWCILYVWTYVALVHPYNISLINSLCQFLTGFDWLIVVRMGKMKSNIKVIVVKRSHIIIIFLNYKSQKMVKVEYVNSVSTKKKWSKYLKSQLFIRCFLLWLLAWLKIVNVYSCGFAIIMFFIIVLLFSSLEAYFRKKKKRIIYNLGSLLFSSLPDYLEET